jgi:hypothetical protein
VLFARLIKSKALVIVAVQELSGGRIAAGPWRGLASSGNGFGLGSRANIFLSSRRNRMKRRQICGRCGIENKWFTAKKIAGNDRTEWQRDVATRMTRIIGLRKQFGQDRLRRAVYHCPETSPTACCDPLFLIT